MKKAKIQVTVKTYFKDGHFRNNRVELTIPEEAAKMISAHGQPYPRSQVSSPRTNQQTAL